MRRATYCRLCSDTRWRAMRPAIAAMSRRRTWHPSPAGKIRCGAPARSKRGRSRRRRVWRNGAPNARSRGKIDEGASLAIFDLDDPKVRIEIELAFEPSLRLVRLDPFVTMGAGEHAVDATLDAFGKLRLRRRTEQCRAPVEAIDLHEDRAGFSRAAPAQDGKGAFACNATDQCCNENVGA